MLKKPLKAYLLVVLAVISTSFLMTGFDRALAGDVLYIDNPNTVKFVVQDDRVYFRNLNEYDGTWLPCCYNYYLDLSTPGGQAAFSTFLSFRLAGQKIMLYKSTWTTGGRIEIVGSF